LRRAVDRLGALMTAAAGWMLIFCAVFMTADVVGRNFLGVSSLATIEISGYMLAFGIAWGLAGALSQRHHVRIDVLVNRLPLGLRQYLHATALLLLSVLAGFFAWSAVELVLESWLFRATDNSVLSIPLILPQGLWAFGICVFFLLTVLMVIEVALLLIAGQSQAVDDMLGSRGYDEESAEALDAVAMARQTTARERRE
jgi:TRAP-type C4-dicarboxylate transport system permease small subunit